MKILHISDLHNDFDILKVIQERYPEHYLVVTGDITDNGSQEEYEHALAALWPFKGKILICDGNHDLREWGNLILKEKAQRFDTMLSIPLNQRGFFFGDNIPIINRIGDVLFIALDSNLEIDIPYYPFEFACGEIGDRQLTALDRILTRNERDGFVIPKKITFLFFHHDPFIRNNPFMYLKDADKLKEVVSGRVDVMSFGHSHSQIYLPGMWGIPHVLEAGKASQERTVAEITIKDGNISVDYVEV